MNDVSFPDFFAGPGQDHVARIQVSEYFHFAIRGMG